ncbi:hypothetical protein [Nocardia higoensis]|uniref:hypothetical protein n=1 Tax=Nocardia higoensis TaxID=228599 RepID=UPI0002E9FB99|nr:hypothetical protein [Nocardia higoensis]
MPQWERYAGRTSARRAAARQLHPDRGGDPAEFVAALASIDRAFPGESPARAATVVTVRHTTAGTWKVRMRRVRDRARRTPRVCRRRYVTL